MCMQHRAHLEDVQLAIIVSQIIAARGKSYSNGVIIWVKLFPKLAFPWERPEKKKDASDRRKC